MRLNCKVPFTKDIDFEKKVSEITSISLEHEIKVESGILKGNFIVSGDFKSHEVSVNKEPFSYILPFEIDLADDIDPDTIEFMIDDFTYEIVDNSILRVNIDFNVIASIKEKLEEEKEEVLFQDANMAFLDEEEKKNDERKTDIEKESTKEEERDINIINDDKNLPNENIVIENVNEEKNEYITYHIHIVNEGESIDTICTMYNINQNILQEYNDLSNIAPKDKLIIPKIDE